jgi:type IV pilus assembly protein PilV
VITSDAANGAPQLGSGSAAPACAAATGSIVTRAMADKDLVDWHNALRGTAEVKSGTNVGGMLGARGCVSRDVATGNYRVAVAWQGMSATIAPTAVDAGATCGRNQYGNDAMRREVSIIFRMANLGGA